MRRTPKIGQHPCAKHPESESMKDGRCAACKREWRATYYREGEPMTSQFSTWKAGVKRRGYSTDMMLGQWLWIKRQSCIYKPQDSPRVASGIDRRDASRGYERSNCQPCCPRHNLIKSDVFTHEQMCEIVARYGIACGLTRLSPSVLVTK